MWLDIGANLVQSVEGPWLASGFWSLNHATKFIPTIQPQHLDLYNRPAHNPTTLPNRNPPSSLWQPASLLPIDYGRSLHYGIMADDPFYALTEIFKLAAASEVQLFNLIEDQLTKHQVNAAGKEPQSRISFVRYTRPVLKRHIQTLQENVTFIENRGGSYWVPKYEGPPSFQSQAMTDELLRDFRYLLHRALNLEEMCLEITSTSMQQLKMTDTTKFNRQITIFTFVTVIFLPISFVASFFGMNSSLFGKESSSRVIYSLFGYVPLLFISLIILFWDSSWLQRLKRVFIIRFRFHHLFLRVINPRL